MEQLVLRGAPLLHRRLGRWQARFISVAFSGAGEHVCYHAADGPGE